MIPELVGSRPAGPSVALKGEPLQKPLFTGAILSDQRAGSIGSPTRDQTSARPARPIVCFPFAGGLAGGSHVSAVKLIRSIDRAAYQPLVLLHRLDGPVAELLRAEDVSFEPAPSRLYVGAEEARGVFGAWTLVALFARLAGFLRRRGVAIVHTNEAAMHATWAGPARLAGAKLLWHHRSGPEARGLRYLAPLLADRVVSVSKYAAPKPGSLSAARKCSVVYSPFEIERSSIDKAACRAALLAEIGEPSDTQIVGFFGHLSRRKRPLIFVEAIAELRRRSPRPRIVGLVFGETMDPGADRMVQERAEQLEVADRIRLMGFRYPPERWLAGCDALLVTAVGEPFGRTLIEAMIVGTPVVAADSGGNPEAIRDGETGLLAPADDPSAFAERTLELLREPQRRAGIAERAHRAAIDAFGVDRHAHSIHQIYRQMAFG